ncbi:MAG: lytic murein transglycosylase [Thermodesulfobacteriota bacterium]
MKNIPLYIVLILLSLSFDATAGKSNSKKSKKLEKARCAGTVIASSIKEVKTRCKLTSEEQAMLDQLKSALRWDGISKQTIEAIFSSPEFGINESGVKLSKNNPEKKVATGEETYQWYKKCFGLDKRIHSYKKFIKTHKEDLGGAEKKYGVDARYIVSILGVESDFSKDKGRYKAINALATQYILVKKRRKFAYRQLKELIEYSERTKKPVYSYTSSYMGAIGCGQFIPSSLNNYFVGESGNIDKADPYDLTDCIYSIAYYLKRSRWDKKQNGTTPVKGSKNWKAIRAYNHSDAYTRFVIETADRLKMLD